MNSTGNVTQGAAITVAGLELFGVAGTYTLTDAGNAIAIVAGNTGSVNITNNTANWSIGTVNTAGLTTTGSTTLGGTGTVTQTASVSADIFTLTGGTWNQVAATLPSFSATDFRITGGTFIRALSGDGTAGMPYQLADIYGVQGMGSSGMLGKRYTLANDVNAAGTASWNSGAGFAPIGNLAATFNGTLDGNHQAINGLTINRPGVDYVGLFGNVGAGAIIQKVGLTGGSVTGYDNVGMLAGNNIGTITKAYSTGIVTNAHHNIGNLVGFNNTGGVLSNSYATGAVSAVSGVGGLAGVNYGTISDSYATGTVTNTLDNGGGLVGFNWGTINGSYAAGTITNTGIAYTKGFVGRSWGGGSGNYWNNSQMATGVINESGGTLIATGLSTPQMQQFSSFAGWSIANTGNSGAIWRIYEGQTAPLLTSFLKPLTVTANAASKTYDAGAYTGGNGVTYSLASPTLSGSLVYGGTSQGAINAGSYVIAPSGYYSNQQGYDISYANGTLTISAAALNAISLAGTRTYDGTNIVDHSIFTLSGLVGGQTLTLSGAGTVADKNVGVNKPVTLGTLALGDGTGLASNYTFAGGTQVATITARPLIVLADAKTKLAGEADPALTYAVGATAAGTGLVGGDSLSGALARIAGETVASSPYAITQGSLSAGSNYSLSFTSNDLVITAAVAVDPCIASPTGAGCPAAVQAAADAAAKAAADAAAAKAAADAQAAADAKALADAQAATDAKALADAQAAANARALADAQAAADTKALADAAAAAAADAAAKIIAEAAAAAKAAATSATVSTPIMTAAVVTSVPGEVGSPGISGGGTSSPTPVASATSSTSATDNSDDKSETKPAAKPVVAAVIVANTTVQKPADQVVQLDRPKGQTLVCR